MRKFASGAEAIAHYYTNGFATVEEIDTEEAKVLCALGVRVMRKDGWEVRISRVGFLDWEAVMIPPPAYPRDLPRLGV